MEDILPVGYHELIFTRREVVEPVAELHESGGTALEEPEANSRCWFAIDFDEEDLEALKTREVDGCVELKELLPYPFCVKVQAELAQLRE